jgi:hypothetical protein
MLQLLILNRPFVGNVLRSDSDIANNYSVSDDLVYTKTTYNSHQTGKLKSAIKIEAIKNEKRQTAVSSMTSYKQDFNDSEVVQIIKKYAQEYSLDEEMLLSISYCESGFNPNAVNGDYAGIYQFASSTWQSNRIAMGLDANPDLRFNAEESARTAAFKMQRDGFSAWPVCSKSLLASN